MSWWDTRTSEAMTAPLSSSHTEPVYSIMWTASKTGTELMTSTEDGLVKWWDIRRMSAPSCQIDLGNCNTRENFSCTKIEYEPTIPSRYMLGSTDGSIICCSRKAKGNLILSLIFVIDNASLFSG